MPLFSGKGSGGHKSIGEILIGTPTNVLKTVKNKAAVFMDGSGYEYSGKAGAEESLILIEIKEGAQAILAEPGDSL